MRGRSQHTRHHLRSCRAKSRRDAVETSRATRLDKSTLARDERGGVASREGLHTAPMNPAAPILFFDSGVGGLSVLAPTRALLPDRADRLCRRQRRFSLWHPFRGRDRRARAGVARPPRRALSPAPRRDRLQHRLDDRPRPCPRRARHPRRRHRPRDQDRRRLEHIARHRRARHRRHRPPALCRRPRRRLRQRLHRHPPRQQGTGRTRRSQAARRSDRPRRHRRRHRPDARPPDRARRSTSSSSPAPISPCSPTRSPPPGQAWRWSTAAPGSRVASPTSPPASHGRTQPPPGIAVFTAPPPPALATALSRFGLDEIATL